MGFTMPEIRVVADYDDLCGEAPLWDPDSGTLYWADSVGLKFYKFFPDTGSHEVVKYGIEINGIALNRSGGFLISNNRGVWLWDSGDNLKLIVDVADGSKCQMNDCIADPEGRLFVGSWFFNPTESYELGKLIRIDVDGTAHVVDEGIHLANGLAFSPDARTLYFTDSAARRIYAYGYDRETGSIRNRRVLVQVAATEGLPDGLTVDAEGYLWSAQWYGGCVVRYDPEGKVERRVQIPAKQTSSVMFGGRDLTDLFITSAAKSEPMPIMPEGYDPTVGRLGGQLYCIHLEIRGKHEYEANFR